MKRKPVEDETYVDDGGPESSDDNSSDEEDDHQEDSKSDSLIDYDIGKGGKMIIVLDSTDFHIPPLEKNTSSKMSVHKSKKSKIDLDREAILEKLKKLDTVDSSMSLTDRVIFSSLPDIYKNTLLTQIGEKQGASSNSDRVKNSEHVEKVLKIPYGKYKKVIPNLSDIPKFIMNLRQKLDDAIYGHQETKEEIIDYMTSQIRNPGTNPHILALKSAPGLGKCHAKDTPILMYDGSTKLVQDINIGDVLMGDDSTPRNVLTLGCGVDTMYKITHLYSNRSYIVNSEHILCLKDIYANSELEITVSDYLSLTQMMKSCWRGISAKVEFKKLHLDSNVVPYESGRMFGEQLLEVPDCILYNDYTTRLEFLKGVVDSIGCYHPYHVEIFTKVEDNSERLVFLIQTLGFLIKQGIKPNGVVVLTVSGDANVYIKHPELFEQSLSCISNRTEQIRVDEVGQGEYYGFTIDGNNRYLMGNCIVTHNTKFARALGEALNLPFQQISFGGLNDVSVLTGHDYTYIGSKPGRIYDAVVKGKCMNSILFIDEIDKIGTPDSDKFIQINGVLTHMLDKEQNSEFYDHYIGSSFNIDLSKMLFIVSFNNEYNVDPVVLNRLKVIEIKDNSIADKVNIVVKFTIPEILRNLNLNSEKFIIEEAVIKHIILHRTVFEKGMRNINKSFSTIFGKINTLLYIENVPAEIRDKITKNLTYEKTSLIRDQNNHITITKDLADKLLPKHNTEPYLSMYN